MKPVPKPPLKPAAGRRRAPWLAIALAATLLAMSGCVHRRFTVRSNPPGARLFVDDYEIGTTPVSHDFTYYGTRKVRLVKDGYETLTVLQPMPTPWWDLPGIDFVSENLWPTELRDHRVLDFQMQPQVIVPTEQLMSRADELRRTRNPNLQAGATAPVGAAPQGTYPENVPPSTAPGTYQLPSFPGGTAPVGPPSGALPPSGAGGTIPGGAAPGSVPPGTFPQGGYSPSGAGPGTTGTVIPSLPAAPTTTPPVWSSAPPATAAPPVVVPPSNPARNYAPPSY